MTAMADEHFRIRRPWNSLPEHLRQTTSIDYRPFQALSKNVFIRADIALSALETVGYVSLLIYLLFLRGNIFVTYYQIH